MEVELAPTEKMMQNVTNRRWLLAGYPEGMPTLENWTLDRQPVPDPGPGQILVKAACGHADEGAGGAVSAVRLGRANMRREFRPIRRDCSKCCKL